MIVYFSDFLNTICSPVMFLSFCALWICGVNLNLAAISFAADDSSASIPAAVASFAAPSAAADPSTAPFAVPIMSGGDNSKSGYESLGITISDGLAESTIPKMTTEVRTMYFSLEATLPDQLVDPIFTPQNREAFRYLAGRRDGAASSEALAELVRKAEKIDRTMKSHAIFKNLADTERASAYRIIAETGSLCIRELHMMFSNNTIQIFSWAESPGAVPVAEGAAVGPVRAGFAVPRGRAIDWFVIMMNLPIIVALFTLSYKYLGLQALLIPVLICLIVMLKKP
jgi:hypothetical protein